MLFRLIRVHAGSSLLFPPGFNFRSSTTDILYGVGLIALRPTPQPGRPGYPFSCESSPLTCLAREALPIATLPPA